MIYNYGFWLTIVSIFFIILERIFPYRKEQKLLRKEFFQDVFWLIFNGFIFYRIFNSFVSIIDNNFRFFTKLDNLFKHINLTEKLPFLVQLTLFIVCIDFTEWCVHILLHKNKFLWKIHRVHHSITEMDWIGNYRFHWLEIIIYKTIKYIPFIILGINWKIVLISAAITTFWGFMNHSNLNIRLGIFKYIFNSPAMHLWHHEKKVRNKYGVNFAILLSAWDYIFKTAYFPKDYSSPKKIGFYGQEKVRSDLFSRFFLPFL